MSAHTKTSSTMAWFRISPCGSWPPCMQPACSSAASASFSLTRTASQSTSDVEPLVVAERVSKRFVLHHNRAFSLKARRLASVYPKFRPRTEDFWALRDVDMRIHKGESVGLVGRNGSGKSTLLKLIAGIHRPSGGRVLVRHGLTIGTMIELGVGFHPDLSGRENVFLNASV